jgi:hypothetical protein
MAAINKQRLKTVEVAPSLAAVTTASTGASDLSGFGVAFVTSTSTGTILSLPTPQVGMVQTVVYAAGGATASTAAALVYTNSTGVTFAGSTNTALSLDAAGEVATFYGLSTSVWAVTVSGTTDGLTLTAP